jgi:hypothetical protein
MWSHRDRIALMTRRTVGGGGGESSGGTAVFCARAVPYLAYRAARDRQRGDRTGHRSAPSFASVLRTCMSTVRGLRYRSPHHSACRHRFWLFRRRLKESLCSRVGSGVQPDNTICQFAGTFTGATGLEPATSGVTGRHGASGYDRLRPGITGYSRRFLTERTGCDRLRPATTRQGLCSGCVVDPFAEKATDVEQILELARGSSYRPASDSSF